MALAAPAVAGADACPGPACPYASTSSIGLQGGGVLRFPQAVTVAPNGNVWVGDDHSYLVQEFTPEGVFLRQFGGYGHGPGRFGSIGAVAVDAQGDVWVLDASNERVQELTPDGRVLQVFGHKGNGPGEFDFNNHGGLALGGGSVWVADAKNDRIQRFDLSGHLQQIIGGTRGTAPGQFYYPQGLAYVGDRLYVADDDNHRVQILDSSGHPLSSFGSYGTGPGQLRYAYDVALDALGNIFVADNNNHRVQEWNANLAFVRTFGSHGKGLGQLGFPRAIATDVLGNVLVADTSGNRIQVFDGAGAFVRAFGISGRTPGDFVLPTGLGRDAQGNLLVADTTEFRIQRLTPGGAFISAFGAQGSTRARFKQPVAVAGAPDGSVYVADRKLSRVVHVDAAGHFIGDIGSGVGSAPGQFHGPLGVSVSPQGTLWVADTANNRVQAFNPSGALLFTRGVDHPVDVAAGPSGSVVILTTGAHALMMLRSGGQVLAQAGSRGSGPGQLRSPAGVTVAPSGTVYVTDGANARVQAFTLLGRYLTTWGSHGDGAGQFIRPRGVTADAAGDVFVSDPYANRVEIFTPAGVPPTVTAAPLFGSSPSLKTLRFVGAGTDRAGAPVTLEWDFGDGGFARGSRPSHRYLHPGLYTVTLRGSNPNGRVGTATLPLRIANRPPTVTLRATPRHVLRGQPIHLTAVHPRDRDGRVVSFAWDVHGTGLYARNTGTRRTTTARLPDAGRFRLRLRAFDDSGGTATRGQAIDVQLGPLLSVSSHAKARGKRVTLSVHCPRTLSHRCRGTVVLLGNGKLLGSARINLRRGVRTHVTVTRRHALKAPLTLAIKTIDDAGASRKATRSLTLDG